MNVGDLVVTVGAKIDGFKTAMGDVSSTATTTASTASVAASKINQVFSAAFGAGVTALAFSAANKFESAFAQIQRSTGATEEKLKGLEESFTNVYKKTAASSEDVAAALSILSTRTGAMGKDLEDLTLKTIKLAKTQREDLNTIVPLVTRAFGDWSIATQDQGKKMDYLRAVSQTTGTSVANLAQNVVYAGAPLRQLGYSFEDATALIGKFEKEGVNTELVLGGMKKAAAAFSDQGVDAAQAWRQLVSDIESGKKTFEDVRKLVGIKPAIDLFKAMQEGRFEIDETTKAAKRLAEEGGAGIETFKTKITKLQHEVEAVVAGHYQIITAIGLTWPALSLLAGGFKTLSVGAVGAISNIVAAFQLGLVPALSTVEMAVLGIGTALAPILGGALVGALQRIQNSIDPNSPAWSILLGLRTAGAAAGFDTGLGPTAKPRVNQADYVTNLVAPKETPSGKGGGGGHKLTDDEIKKDFSTLGLKDLEADLANATKAFAELTAAHKLNDAQVEQATKHLVDLRAAVAEMRAGYGAEGPPKATADLLKTLGIADPNAAANELRGVGSALAELKRRQDEFVGPKTAESTRLITEAWQAYGRAVLVAQEAEEKRKVPLYDAIEAQNKQNAALQETIDALNAMPAAQRPVVASIMDAWGALKGITEAYHYFNIKTPAELELHANEAKRQYDIIKNAAGSAATAAQIAWHKSVLAQIELDHALGITDEELYNQRKKMAEDALKTLEGSAKGSTDVIRKHVWSAADDMKRAVSGAFDSMYRTLGDSLVPWKGFGDAAKGIIQNLASDMTSIMLKAFFQPVEKQLETLAGRIGGALPSWMGGGGGGTPAPGGSTPSIPGGGGAGGAASAATGWMGAVNMVSGAVSAISSVVGNFQMMGMNKSLDVLVNHTLATANDLANLRRDEWDREGHLMLKLDDIWNEIRNVVSAVRETWTGVGMPDMAAAAPGNITVNVQGTADPAETARHVVSHLKRNGVYL